MPLLHIAATRVFILRIFTDEPFLEKIRTMNASTQMKWGALALVGIIFCAIGLLFLGGYRLGAGGDLKRPGSIEILVPRAGSVVYLDGTQQQITESDNERVSVARVASGAHEVLVSQNLYWPWKKEVTVGSGQSVALKPFLVNQNTSGSIITTSDPEYYRITQMIAAARVPEPTSKKVSADGAVAVWVEGKDLKAEWRGESGRAPSYFCKPTCSSITVLSMEEKQARAIDFYGARSDVLVVAIDGGIYALEIDPSGTQNFQPIFQGVAPSFVLGGTGSLLVRDGNQLLEVGL